MERKAAVVPKILSRSVDVDKSGTSDANAVVAHQLKGQTSAVAKYGRCTSESHAFFCLPWVSSLLHLIILDIWRDLALCCLFRIVPQSIFFSQNQIEVPAVLRLAAPFHFQKSFFRQCVIYTVSSPSPYLIPSIRDDSVRFHSLRS
jgi:hypothetical protein